jgi:hypothetical protein
MDASADAQSKDGRGFSTPSVFLFVPSMVFGA